MDLKWIENPEIFEVNTVEPHSDHLFYFDENKTTKEISLNGNWKFKYIKNIDDIDLNFCNEDYNNSHWDNIRVPAHIELSGYENPKYVNTMYPWDGIEDLVPPSIPQKINRFGLYSKEVELDFCDNETYIRFEGVESAIYLWVNGEFIGYSEDTFTPSEFNITKVIKKGKNKISALIVKFSTGSWLEDQDFWRFFGIFRDVKIYTTPKVHVYDLNIKTELNKDFSGGSLNVELKVKSNSTDAYKIYYEFLGETKEVDEKFQINATDIVCWSAEEPKLYDLKIKIYEGDNVIEIVDEKVGFRKFELDNKLMLINGKPISFRGVNRHEFNCNSGRVVSYEETKEDIIIMKQNNINSLRTSHYPNNSYLYRLCDEFGLYVIDETNLETHGTWMAQGKVLKDSEYIVPHNKDAWRKAVIQRGKNMLERDKNHPSIIIFSCGNESYGGDVIADLADYFRETDSSRLVHYEGIFHDRSFNNTSDMESHMYTYPEKIVEYLENAPEKPIIMCEYSHSMGNSSGGLHKYIEVEEKYQMYQGGFIWDFVDQSLLVKNDVGVPYFTSGGDFYDRPNDGNFCGNGIVFADRSITPKMAEVKFLYSPIKIEIFEKDFQVTNKNLFISTDDYNFIYKIFKMGELVRSEKLNIYIESNTSEKFTLPKECLSDEFEYTIVIECVLKNSNNWASAGHEVSHGQKVINKYSTRKHALDNVKVTNGGSTIGITLKNSTYLIDKNTGFLTSINQDGIEYLKMPLRPNFWRAPIDNEIGSGLVNEFAQWKMADLYLKLSNIEILSEGVKVQYKLPEPLNEEICSVTYTFNDDNSLNVDIKLENTKNIHIMPIFGIKFKLNKDYNNFQWYGNYNLESYVDRKESSKIILNKNKVSENYINYLKPQECGNKTDVRYFEVTNAMGRGLRVSSNEPFEVSALPYTSHEIENAKNSSELPSISSTVIAVSKFNTGVGGDDSWGAKPHKEYIFTNEHKKLSFAIEVK